MTRAAAGPFKCFSGDGVEPETSARCCRWCTHTDSNASTQLECDERQEKRDKGLRPAAAGTLKSARHIEEKVCF